MDLAADSYGIEGLLHTLGGHRGYVDCYVSDRTFSRIIKGN